MISLWIQEGSLNTMMKEQRETNWGSFKSISSTVIPGYFPQILLHPAMAAISMTALRGEVSRKINSPFDRLAFCSIHMTHL